MTLKSLPAAPAGRPSALSKRDLPSAAMERWNGGIKAAKPDENSISVFDVIGSDYWGDGETASRIAGALRSMNGADVTVNINSPGGDMFEGLAIYNLLREYEGKVTVKVLGLAASAASIIAMAGDDIQIGRGAFLMTHNCWVYAMGNRHDLEQIAADMAPFDKAMGDTGFILVDRVAKVSPGDLVALQMEGNPMLGKWYPKHLMTEDGLIEGDQLEEVIVLGVVTVEVMTLDEKWRPTI